MAADITLEATVEKAGDSAACAVLVATDEVVRWFGRKSRVPVAATINGYAWRTSLSPMGGCHVLPVNADVRRGASVAAGDNVTLTMHEDTAERTIGVPDDLAQALHTATMRKTFDAMAFTHRKEWVNAVLAAKRPETRTKRIAECVTAMRAR